jgi:hypothetical protein
MRERDVIKLFSMRYVDFDRTEVLNRVENFLQCFGVILPPRECATILPSRMTKVSITPS